MRKTGAISLVLFAGFMAFCSAAWGQEKEAGQKPTAEPIVRKLIQLKYVDPGTVEFLFMAENSKGTSFWGVVKGDNQRKVLAVAGTGAEVSDVEEAVKKLDVPPVPGKDVEITAYFLVASRQPNMPSDFPSMLNDVVAELKKVLTYQSFSLTNTAIMRTLDGQQGTISGAVDKGMPPDQFRLDYRCLTVSTQEKATIVHLDNLDFSILSQKHWEKSLAANATDHEVEQNRLAEISTSVDVPVGQKVVVGKTAYGASDAALVLVLTAKVMD